jgi:hypothetical protein
MSTFEKKFDLESAICDIDDMAKVCLILVDILEKNEQGIAELGVTGKQAVDYLAERREAVSFSVLHLNGMTHDLKKQYLASPE